MARIIVPAHYDHLFWLASNIRKADRDEVGALGMGPYRALADSLARSIVAWTGLVDDRPVCMWGVTPMDILLGIGSPWLLGADDLPKYAMTFLRLNKGYVANMLELFPTLVNFVDVRNELSIKWLKWLGFEFDSEPVAYGVWKRPFLRFSMEGSNV